MGNALEEQDYADLVKIALAEDVTLGDATSLATIPAEKEAIASVVARQSMTVAGIPVASYVFHRVDPALKITRQAEDHTVVAAGDVLIKIEGSARSLLAGERVALNFLQRLSGIATLTARFVEAVKGTRARILDTRKTTPGWRKLEKYAVSCGGGKNHRFGLFDMILIKDNHLAVLHGEEPNAVAAAVERARRKFPELKVEVEADTLEQVLQAVEAGVEMILLDNMSIEMLQNAVRHVAGRCQTEASGGVNLNTVRAIAETGVDFISVGALTHSVSAADIALDFMG